MKFLYSLATLLSSFQENKNEKFVNIGGARYFNLS